MREKPNELLEKSRVTWGRLASDSSYGNNGAFIIDGNDSPYGTKLNIVASDGGGWEHVSVDAGKRCPTWDEMCFVKDLFWRRDETVIQYHPAEDDYVNMHATTLHLWKPVGKDIPLPPPILVGIGSRKHRHTKKE